jgi:glutathionylspermidine synthase
VSVYESSILQRLWLEDLKKGNVLPQRASQFNSLHKDLIATFAKLVDREKLCHFTCSREAPEDEGNTRYIESCAVQAGQPTAFVYIQDVRYDSERRMIDQKRRLIKRLFKLYPWEDFIDDDLEFLENSGRSSIVPIVEQEQIQFFEPIWKVVLANKGILPILYEMNPDCRFILPSYFENSEEAQQIKLRPHVRKPLYGRGGFSISIVHPDDPEMTMINTGPYGDEGFILQDLHTLPEHNQHHVVLSAWVLDSKPAGIGLRADLSRITTATNSVFVPHYIID